MTLARRLTPILKRSPVMQQRVIVHKLHIAWLKTH
jgi:hypothetical protein